MSSIKRRLSRLESAASATPARAGHLEGLARRYAGDGGPAPTDGDGEGRHARLRRLFDASEQLAASLASGRGR